MIATCGFLTALECTKFDFGRGAPPDPAGGAYSAPSDPLYGLRGLLLRGGEGKGRERRGGEGAEEVGQRQGTGEWKGRGRDARERGGKGGRRGGERRIVRNPFRQFLPIRPWRRHITGLVIKAQNDWRDVRRPQMVTQPNCHASPPYKFNNNHRRC